MRHSIAIEALGEDCIDAIVDESHHRVQCAERSVTFDFGEETACPIEVIKVLSGNHLGDTVRTGQ